VVAALPPFVAVRDWILGIEGEPLVSLAIATDILAALTGSASGGLTIALEALGRAYMKLAAATGLDPALMCTALPSSDENLAGTVRSLLSLGGNMKCAVDDLRSTVGVNRRI
jgi:hypothetical protein